MSSKLRNAALKLIEENLVLNKEAPVDFLAVLAAYDRDNELIKKNIRSIKKAIKLTKKLLNKDYLLLKTNEMYSRNFNDMFLIVSPILCNKLNELDYTSMSDSLQDIILKVELGFERYFRKNKLIFFNTNYNMISEDINKLHTLRTISKIKNKTDIKKYDKLLNFFPEFIYEKNDFNFLDLEKSTFFHEKFDVKEFKKDGFIIRNLNNLNTAAFILNILKNER